MQMQDLSFKLKNKEIKYADLDISIELFTVENQYTFLDCQQTGNTYIFTNCVWGGTEKVDGQAILEVTDIDGKLSFDITAKLPMTIRSTKLKIKGLPLGTLVSLLDQIDRKVTPYGMLYKYPEGWRGVITPLLVYDVNAEKHLYVRSLDHKVREKRFFMKEENGQMTLELIYEEAAVDMTNEVKVPTWEIGYDQLESIYKTQAKLIEKNYDLVPFEQRPDTPKWLTEISLVVICHMEHWTGNIFHTYKDVVRDIKRLTEHVDGKHILVYLPGWEGRYYFQYGKYEADSRLGGEEDLHYMVNELHKMGRKVMAMYGINMTNRYFPEYKEYGEESLFLTPSGATFDHGSVDWDSSRHYDHHSNAQVNPAAPLWQEVLSSQIINLSKKYNFDAAFLDIAAVWVNDLRYELTPGIVKMCQHISSSLPEFVVAGEAWYDGLSNAMPLFHSGHTEGMMHYHDGIYEDMFTPYVREFAHLCLGDLATGSTGTHELGTNDDCITPFRKGVIPTLTLVGDTLDLAYDKVVEVLKQANRYKEEFLDDND